MAAFILTSLALAFAAALAVAVGLVWFAYLN